LLLVVFVVLIGPDFVKKALSPTIYTFDWPGLHNAVMRVAPTVQSPSPYAARFTFNFLTASGTACMAAAIISALVLGMGIGQFFRTLGAVARQLAFSLLTIASVLGLAFLMNYSGATATLGLAFAATGVLLRPIIWA
jgi:lactate permease